MKFITLRGVRIEPKLIISTLRVIRGLWGGEGKRGATNDSQRTQKGIEQTTLRRIRKRTHTRIHQRTFNRTHPHTYVWKKWFVAPLLIAATGRQPHET